MNLNVETAARPRLWFPVSRDGLGRVGQRPGASLGSGNPVGGVHSPSQREDLVHVSRQP